MFLLVPPLARGRTPVTSAVRLIVLPPDRMPEADLTKPSDNPLKVIVPEEVIPVAAAIAPELFTWNWLVEPTDRREVGLVVPTPRLPAMYVSPSCSTVNLSVSEEPEERERRSPVAVSLPT